MRKSNNVTGWAVRTSDTCAPATIAVTRETIEVGERSGARVMATHLKLSGEDLWGSSAEALALIGQASERGVRIYLDTYTYESYGNTATVALVPTWALVAEGVDIGGQVCMMRS